MRPDTDNFLFPLRRLSPPPPANSPPAKPAVGSDTLPEAGYARYTDENYPTVCVACFSPSPPYYTSPTDISIPLTHYLGLYTLEAGKCLFCSKFKSNAHESWCVILVSES